MVRVGKGLKKHLVPTPLPCARTLFTRPNCSGPHPTWQCTYVSESLVRRDSSVSYCQVLDETAQYNANADGQINPRARTPNMKFYFWVLKMVRGMQQISNQAVLPTIGYWPSTLRAGGKSPTELSSSLPSCWVAAQALDWQEKSLCKQAGLSLEMVPAMMALSLQREVLGNTAALHGPSDWETRLSTLSFYRPQKWWEKWNLNSFLLKTQYPYSSVWKPLGSCGSDHLCYSWSKCQCISSLLQADLLCDGFSTHHMSICYIRQIFQKGYHFLFPFFFPIWTGSKKYSSSNIW